MSDTAQRSARVELRHVVLAEAAAVREEGKGRVFLALEDPPPVRSILALSEDGSSRTIEVMRVVEVPERGESRGVHGRVVDAEALARSAAVGTERLPGGVRDSVSTQISVEPARSDSDPSGAQLAMPAPVMVVEDNSEPISVGEPDDGEASDEPESDEGEGAPKKRKGRKRR